MYFTRKTKAQYYDCDHNDRLKISAAMQYMQQTSSEHLESLGMSPETLREQGLVFLLSKMCIKVHKMPLCTQNIVLGTAPTQTKGVRFIREFVIDSQEGERMLSAQSLWVLTDPDTHSILRPKAFPYPLPFQDSIVNGAVDDIPIPKIEIPQPAESMDIPIRYSHIDCNRHVNNSMYAGFVCDALPYEELQTHGIDTLALRFQNEAKWGETLRVRALRLSDRGYYIEGTHSGAPCFEAVVHLRHTPPL